MTPDQMLKIVKKVTASPWPPPAWMPDKCKCGATLKDDEIRLCKLCVTALQVSSNARTTPVLDDTSLVGVRPAMRVGRKTGEPWLVEQLDLGWCPTCGKKLEHLKCTLDPVTHFYTCTENAVEHRWTLVDNR